MREVAKGPDKRILLVDDDSFQLAVYANKFREEGFHVIEARDGLEGWMALERGPVPDVVFTGIRMPQMTGFELLGKMKADPRFVKIPVAISSHYGKPEDRQKAEELGAADFIFRLNTPVVEVVRRIRRLIGAQRMFKIALTERTFDAENLIHLLDVQEGTSHNLSRKKLYLALEPDAEKGKFTVRLKEE
ncbi:MAG: response regulator [Candidatus Liptonbacteria bacterium]|nr:response regulator [Candidatus Liptonbacteria bacterium]